MEETSIEITWIDCVNINVLKSTLTQSLYCQISKFRSMLSLSLCQSINHCLFYFTSWASGEPSGDSWWKAWRHENCVHYDEDQGMRWNDEDCDDDY